MTVRARLRRSLLPVSLGFTSFLSACDSGSCFFFALFSVDVQLVDASTLEAVVSDETRVTVRDGAYAEELRPAGDGTFRGVEGRPGRYTVTVSSPGYEPWVAADIIIRSNDCDATPRVVTATLSRRAER